MAEKEKEGMEQAKAGDKPDKKEDKGKAHAGKKMHLHEIRTVEAGDGSFVHHHTYKEHRDHPHTMPERGPMATSKDHEEAGEHVAEQFGMNEPVDQEHPVEEGGEQEPTNPAGEL